MNQNKEKIEFGELKPGTLLKYKDHNIIFLKRSQNGEFLFCNITTNSKQSMYAASIYNVNPSHFGLSISSRKFDCIIL